MQKLEEKHILMLSIDNPDTLVNYVYSFNRGHFSGDVSVYCMFTIYFNLEGILPDMAGVFRVPQEHEDNKTCRIDLAKKMSGNEQLFVKKGSISAPLVLTDYFYTPRR
jgi:hypothetical protein